MRTNKNSNNESGFTLIEMIIYSTIAIILIISLYYGLSSANRSYHTTSTTINEIREARRSLETIFEELKYSSNVKITTAQNQIKSYFYSTENTSRAIYLGADNKLYRKIGNNPATLLTNIPLQSFSCSFNTNVSDTSNRFIDINIQFSNKTQLKTTVNTLNTSGTNEYIP
jgi:type II secretory pathway pseudopilin PulG